MFAVYVRVEMSFNPTYDGRDNLRRLYELFRDSTDAFGKVIADSTTTMVDVPSFYAFNPERHRLYINGARQKVDDAIAAGDFEDLEGSFRLNAAQGDEIEMHTAERPRYVVGKESVATAAGVVDSDLGANDQWVVGVRDRSVPENLAYFEVNGDGNHRAVLEGGGAEVASEPFTFPENVDETKPVRYEIRFNWYNVGRYLFTVSYTDDSKPVGEKQRRANLLLNQFHYTHGV